MMNTLEHLMHVADVFNSQIVIRIRNFAEDENMLCYAEIEHLEVADRGILISSCGNGATPERALEDYWHKIRGRTLVNHAGCSNEIRRTL